MALPVKSQPTLVLRRIRPDEVRAGYLAGKYSKTTLTESSVTASPITRPLIESGLVTRTLTDRSGTALEFVISHPRQEGEVRRCAYCELPFKNGYGVPSRVSIETRPDGSRIKKYLILDVCYNSLECLKTDYLQSVRRNTNDRHCLHVDSESLVHQMIFDLTGERNIRDAYPPKLLNTKSGTMTPEEYLKGSHLFVPSSDVVLIQASSQYLKMKQGMSF